MHKSRARQTFEQVELVNLLMWVSVWKALPRSARLMASSWMCQRHVSVAAPP
jgi:hypothetical protein